VIDIEEAAPPASRHPENSKNPAFMRPSVGFLPRDATDFVIPSSRNTPQWSDRQRKDHYAHLHNNPVTHNRPARLEAGAEWNA
jgi:hypothetical protein